MHFQAAAKSFWAHQWCDDFKLAKYCHTVIGCVLSEIKTICQNCPCFFFWFFFFTPFCCWNSQVTSRISSCIKVKDFQPTGASASSLATKSDLLLITEVITKIHVTKTPFQLIYNCTMWLGCHCWHLQQLLYTLNWRVDNEF